ncbi:hypothetical protein [Sphingorhabdus sp. Alg231-15]|uniref:hypothetical protein n=1 Tax=Sphingorhabdus sp. Alg231-15 TaxID=1922222 RepID=UPI00307C4658
MPFNMPAKASPLRQAFAKHNYNDRREWLKSYVEDSLEVKQEVFGELISAGFRHEQVRDGTDMFYWRGRPAGRLFQEVMIVAINGNNVETNCGAIAP